VRLTDVAVRKAKPKARAYKLADGRGLSLLIQPNGAKWWRYRYRFHGIEKMLSMGAYPDVTLVDARKRLNAARRLLANGVDPSIERKKQKAARTNTFEIIARHLTGGVGFLRSLTILHTAAGSRRPDPPPLSRETRILAVRFSSPVSPMRADPKNTVVSWMCASLSARTMPELSELQRSRGYGTHENGESAIENPQSCDAEDLLSHFDVVNANLHGD
jgi:hypothetical protein